MVGYKKEGIIAWPEWMKKATKKWKELSLDFVGWSSLLYNIGLFFFLYESSYTTWFFLSLN